MGESEVSENSVPASPPQSRGHRPSTSFQRAHQGVYHQWTVEQVALPKCAMLCLHLWSLLWESEAFLPVPLGQEQRTRTVPWKLCLEGPALAKCLVYLRLICELKRGWVLQGCRALPCVQEPGTH